LVRKDFCGNSEEDSGKDASNVNEDVETVFSSSDDSPSDSDDSIHKKGYTNTQGPYRNK